MNAIAMDLDLASWKQELEQRKEYFESKLKTFMSSPGNDPGGIQTGMNYALFNGGKRLRPLLVLEGARLAGLNPEKVIPTACALEMIHSYSLVHDDLPAMDNDELRRGKPTCHIQFGEANAILIGDALLTEAFTLLSQNAWEEEISKDAVLKVIKEVAHAAGSQGMVGGQVLDLIYEEKAVPSLAALENLHSLKTGALFRAALRSGAILGGMNEAGLACLSTYAGNFGLAFQITDDILDVCGQESLLGKPVGSDEKNHKSTYVTFLGVDKARKRAEQYVAACLESLKKMGPEANWLRSLAIFLLHRKA